MGKAIFIIIAILAMIFAIFMQSTVGNPPAYDAMRAQAKEEGLKEEVQLSCGLGLLPILVPAFLLLVLVGRVLFVSDTVEQRYAALNKSDIPYDDATQNPERSVPWGWNKELIMAMFVLALIGAVYLFVTA